MTPPSDAWLAHAHSLGDLGRCTKNTNGVAAAYALLLERGWPAEGWWQLG